MSGGSCGDHVLLKNWRQQAEISKPGTLHRRRAQYLRGPTVNILCTAARTGAYWPRNTNILHTVVYSIYTCVEVQHIPRFPNASRAAVKGGPQ